MTSLFNLKEEIWKDIPNYQGYQVSNYGRVRTFNKITFCKKHGERHWKNRILKFKGETPRTGYRVELWKNGTHKAFLVARLVAFTFYEKDINNHDLTVNHKDGNRLNNNLSNLELITLKENILHAFNNGLNSSCKKIKIINKKTFEENEYRSMSVASKKINRNHGYLSHKINKGIYEDKDYKWELI